MLQVNRHCQNDFAPLEIQVGFGSGASFQPTLSSHIVMQPDRLGWLEKVAVSSRSKSETRSRPCSVHTLELLLSELCNGPLGSMKGEEMLRYSDRLRTGRPRGRSSSPGRGKIFLIFTSSRPVLGPTQHPIQWVLEALSPGSKVAGA
jgi:hypothetical protein